MLLPVLPNSLILNNIMETMFFYSFLCFFLNQNTGNKESVGCYQNSLSRHKEIQMSGSQHESSPFLPSDRVGGQGHQATLLPLSHEFSDASSEKIF